MGGNCLAGHVLCKQFNVTCLLTILVVHDYDAKIIVSILVLLAFMLLIFSSNNKVMSIIYS